jgi:hypothetical protein
MASGSAWDQESKKLESIAGDRRFDRRYSILLDLQWKLIHRKRVLDAGAGKTLDVSGGGVRFESGRTLPKGLKVELAISWPILLRGLAPMQLVVQGRILRSEGGRTAIRMIQHEFRTVGISTHLGSAPSKAGRPHMPFLPNINAMASLRKIQ